MEKTLKTKIMNSLKVGKTYTASEIADVYSKCSGRNVTTNDIISTISSPSGRNGYLRKASVHDPRYLEKTGRNAYVLAGVPGTQSISVKSIGLSPKLASLFSQYKKKLQLARILNGSKISDRAALEVACKILIEAL